MYTFITQYSSPNYTPGSQTRSVWGRDRSIQEIVIHWWDNPANNPSFEGVIATLTNPNRQASAHFVATGTGRRVACLVAPADNAWASNNDNPISIAIECDPRCRDEDYDVVAELVAELRATYGNLPLKRHGQIVQTTCPGNWDLNRINQIAATKIAKASDQFGMATGAEPAKTAVTVDQVKQAYRDVLEREADADGINHYTKSGMTIEAIRADLQGSQEYKNLQANKAKAQADAIKAAADKAAADAAALSAAKAAAQAKADAERIAAEKAAQEAAVKAAQGQKDAAQDAQNQADQSKQDAELVTRTTLWQKLAALIDLIIKKLGAK